MAEVCNAVPEHFAVLSGDDAVTLPLIALGGVGIISVASNEIPREMAEMTRAALNNDWETARRIHRKYLPLMLGELYRVQPPAGESRAGHDGQDRRGLPAPHAADAPRHPIQAAKDRCRSGADRKGRGAPKPPIFMFTKTGWRGRTKSCCIAPVAASVITARAPGRSRCQPRAVAWPVSHALRGP